LGPRPKTVERELSAAPGGARVEGWENGRLKLPPPLGKFNPAYRAVRRFEVFPRGGIGGENQPITVSKWEISGLDTRGPEILFDVAGKKPGRGAQTAVG